MRPTTKSILHVINREAEKLQESQLSLDKQKGALATKVAQYERTLGEELSLLKNIGALLSPASTQTNGGTEMAAQPSNVSRNVTVAREEPKSILARFAVIVIEAGKALTTDEILGQLDKRGWTPDSKNVKGYVSQRLATFSAPKDKAGKNDVLLREAPGLYAINPKAMVPMGRNRKVSVADLRNGTVSAEPSNSNGGATHTPVEPVRKIDVKARALKALKGMRKPVTFKMIADEIKVPATSFLSIGRRLIDSGVLKKTRAKEGKSPLFKVNHPKVNAAIKAAAAA